MPAFLSGLLGGFADATAQSRKQAADDEATKRDREDRVLQWLAQSDDQDIQHAAIAGLTDPTPRKKGFLDNLIGGQYQPNPALGHIATLINTAKQVPGQPGMPVHSGLGPLPPSAAPPAQAPTGASAAMPATSGAQKPPAAAQLGSPSGPPGPPPSMGAPESGTDLLTQLRTGPVVGTSAGTPATSVPRQVFMSPVQRIGAEANAKVLGDLNADRDALRSLNVPEDQIQQALTSKIRGRMGTTAPHYMGNVLGKDALDEAGRPGVDEGGQPLNPAQMYRHMQDPAGHSHFTPVSSVTGNKPIPVTAMADPVTHARDMTGTSTRQARFMYHPDTQSYDFVGFTTPGPRDQAFPFQWEDEQGTHREVVYAEPKFEQGVNGAGGAGPMVGPPPAASQGVGGPPTSATPPPPAKSGGAPPSPNTGGGTAGAGITRVPVGGSPPKMQVAHARMPSGAFVSALRNPVSKQLVDPKTNQPIEGATDATPQQVAQQQQAMGQLGQINAGLNDIEGLIKKVYPAGSGFVGGLAAGASITAQGLRHNPDLAALKNRITLASGPIARVIEMANRMNLTVVKQAAEALGSPDKGIFHTSSQEEALAKLNAVRAALNEATDQMGIVMDPQGQPHQFDTRAHMDAFKARVAAYQAAHPQGQ